MAIWVCGPHTAGDSEHTICVWFHSWHRLMPLWLEVSDATWDCPECEEEGAGPRSGGGGGYSIWWGHGALGAGDSNHATTTSQFKRTLQRLHGPTVPEGEGGGGGGHDVWF